jgi:hypothetical protein
MGKTRKKADPSDARSSPSALAEATRFLSLVLMLLVVGVSFHGCGKKKGDTQWLPHYRKAVEAYRRGDYGRAVELFKKALVLEPSNAEIYLDIAAIYDDFLKNAEGAVSNYEKYVKLVKSGEKTEWAKRWMENARRRLASPTGEEHPGGSGTEAEADKDKLIEGLREQLRTSNQALAEERTENESLAKRVSTLSRDLAAARKEKDELERKLASYAAASPAVKEGERGSQFGPGDSEASTQGRRPPPVSWLLCGALGILVVALVVGQRYARAREKTLLAGIQAAASGSGEQIGRDDILGKYYWVENDHSAGVLNFSEKDGEIHACAIDGTTRLRSRGKGKLVGNVLTAELHTGGGESVVTKFIFANKGRTVTAVWQGDEGTSVAAGTKAVGE